VLAHGEGGGGASEHRVGLHVLAALGTRADAHGEEARRHGVEFLAHPPAQRVAVALGEGQPGHDVAAAVDEVALPAGPDQGVAQAHQEAVAGVLGLRHVGAAAIVEAQEAAVAPVGELVQEAAAAPGDVDGLDDIQRGGELDEAGGIARGQVEIDDRGQAGLGRVDREVGMAEQALIGAGLAEGDAPGEGLPARDVEPDLVLCHHGPPGWAVADRRRGDHGPAAGARAGAMRERIRVA
jgi:hypothetical protein